MIVPEMSTLTDTNWSQMLGKVLEMESLERSEAHSFDPQRLFAHDLKLWPCFIWASTTVLYI